MVTFTLEIGIVFVLVFCRAITDYIMLKCIEHASFRIINIKFEMLFISRQSFTNRHK